MAETSTAPNNKVVSFKSKPQRETTKLRQKVKRAMRKGLISEKAAKRHLGY